MTASHACAKVSLTYDVLKRTFSFLRGYGERGLESHALWVGHLSARSFSVVEAWFPEQKNTCASYEVSEEEEFNINKRLHDNGLVAMCQIHTHPGSAFHSLVDDEGSALSLPGSLSIVIPDYGFIEMDQLSLWKVYALVEGSWRAMKKCEVRRTFQIT